MDENERGPRLSPEIYVYATNKNFLNLYDALRIEKLKIEIAGYDPNTNRQTGHATAWIDKDDARLLSHLICQRLFPQVTGGTWERYGGSQREDGSIESRTLSVQWDEGEGGRFARYPYKITIANGPGKKTATGGVAPAGEPHSRLTMRMPEIDTMKVMLAVGDYIRAYETAHHHRLVAQRLRDLREKLAERGFQQTAHAAPAAPDGAAESSREPQPRRGNAPAPAPLRPPLTAIEGGGRDNIAQVQPPARRLGGLRAG